MVQKEVAERICATPGEMSLLAVSVQFYAQPRLVQVVPARAFYPRPKVDSAVVRLDIASAPPAAIDPEAFFTLVRAGFSQKRKQLHNTLSVSLGMRREAVVELLTQAQIEPSRRAETLALAEWQQLYHAWQRESLHKPKNL
jgi:16S rRNA (adenine1518-N6/adenine1519-N6)-dimethyltransferase